MNGRNCIRSTWYLMAINDLRRKFHHCIMQKKSINLHYMSSFPRENENEFVAIACNCLAQLEAPF